MKNVPDDKGVMHRMAECQLVIDPFEEKLARELGESVADHLYSDGHAIRRELATVTLDPRVPNQHMTVSAVKDMAGVSVRDVAVGALVCTRQVDEKSGAEWIKATVKILFDLAPKVHREWLVMHFGSGMLFTFVPEQTALAFEGAPGAPVFDASAAFGKARMAEEV